MKTGAAIALTVGAIGVTGLIIWGVTANRIIDMADKPGGGGAQPPGAGFDCGTVRVDEESTYRWTSQAAEIASQFKRSSNALSIMKAICRTAWPDCPWDDDTRATIINNQGNPMEWSTIVAVMRHKTYAQVEADPALMAFLRAGDGTQAASGSVLDGFRGLRA